jgi:hypothetical protein
MIEEDVDYREISREEAIKLWPTNRLTPHNAKFYQVTGECFKMIGMLKNKDIRKYYLKVEELAVYMKDFLLEIYQGGGFI